MEGEGWASQVRWVLPWAKIDEGPKARPLSTYREKIGCPFFPLGHLKGEFTIFLGNFGHFQRVIKE